MVAWTLEQNVKRKKKITKRERDKSRVKQYSQAGLEDFIRKENYMNQPMDKF